MVTAWRGGPGAAETVTVQHTVGEGHAQGLIKGEFDMAQALQADEALLGGGEARVEDILGGADGRATVTGVHDLTVCHASRMPGHPLVYTQHSLPFEQQVSLSGEAGEMLSASVDVTDVAAALEKREARRCAWRWASKPGSRRCGRNRPRS